MFGRQIAALLLLAGCTQGLHHSEAYSQPIGANADHIVRFSSECEKWDEWDKPAEPFRVFGNTYYVGTCGIAAIYIPGQGEDILIDSGTEAGAEIVLTNVRKLGFDPKDIRYVGTSHEHFDHVGGLAKLNRVSKAYVGTSYQAVSVIQSGEADPEDPQYGMHDPMEPIADVGAWDAPEYSELLTRANLRAIATPGHTPGALSWYWRSCYGDVCRDIVYADSLSPVSRDDYRFSDHPEYFAEYRAGLQRLRGLKCDILLTPHPSASKMLERAATGSFEGGMTCIEYADAVERRLNARLEREAGGDQ